MLFFYAIFIFLWFIYSVDSSSTHFSRHDSSTDSVTVGHECNTAEFNRMKMTIEYLQEQVMRHQKDIETLQKQVAALYGNKSSSTSGLSYQDINTTYVNATSDAISSSLPRSCQEIKATSPDPVSSGYYTIADSDGLTRHVYCHMGELCGSDKGWTRIAYLDMSNGEEKCPDGLRLYEVNGVRACAG